MNTASSDVFAAQTVQEWFPAAAYRVKGLKHLAAAMSVPGSVLSEFHNGNRNIPEAKLKDGVEALARSDEEREQALALVELHEAGEDRLRREAAQLWVESGRLLHLARLGQSAASEFSLHAFALRALCDGVQAPVDAAALAARLRARHTAAEVNDLLGALEQSGLLSREVDGRWRRAPHPAPAAVVHLMPPQLETALHQAQLLAAESLACVHASERAYELLIPLVPVKELPWLRLALRRLQGRVLALCERAHQTPGAGGDAPVYTLLTQLVPLTWPVSHDGAPERSAAPLGEGASMSGAPSALLYDDYHDFVRGWVAAWREEEHQRVMATPKRARRALTRTNGKLAMLLKGALDRSGSSEKKKVAHKGRLQKFISELLQVPKGDRTPSEHPQAVVQIDPATLAAWGEVLKLQPNELMYFSASVYQQRALARRQLDTAKLWGDVMGAVRQIGLAAEVPGQVVAEILHWLPVALSELLFHPGFQEDPAWALGVLRPVGITEDDVREAMGLLERAKLTARDAEGGLRPARPRSVSMGPGELPIAARDLYRSAIELGPWAQSALSHEERSLGLSVVRVPPQAQEAVRAELRTARALIQGRLDRALEEAMARSKVGDGGVQVMVMTCCWFPLTG